MFAADCEPDLEQEPFMARENTVAAEQTRSRQTPPPAPPLVGDAAIRSHALAARQARMQEAADEITVDDRTGATAEEADLMNRMLAEAGGTVEARDKVLRTWQRGMTEEGLRAALDLEPLPAPEGEEIVISSTTGDQTRTDVKYPQKGAVLFAGVDAKEFEPQTGNPVDKVEPGMQGQATIERGRNHMAPVQNDSAERNRVAPPAYRARNEGGQFVARPPGARTEAQMKADAGEGDGDKRASKASAKKADAKE